MKPIIPAIVFCSLLSAAGSTFPFLRGRDPLSEKLAHQTLISPLPSSYRETDTLRTFTLPLFLSQQR